MVAVLIQVLPFFAVIALGYLAGRTGFFSEAATAALTKFVFYFALSAMLLRFSATLNLGDVVSWPFIWAYLIGTSAIYIVATIIALVRRIGVEQAAVEAQCAVIGNTGFLGVPMLALLFGEEAIGPVMLCLAVDLVVFSSLIVILITGTRDGRVSPKVLGTVAMGLVKNPMIVSIVAGFSWSATGIPLPGPVTEMLTLLGAAATPGALFAIGASLASKSAERLSVAVWLSFAKLVLHPAAVAVMAIFVFTLDAFSAKVMIATAALPVAGNVFILAQHYGVAPMRVSAAILVSTAVSIFTVAGVIALVG
ncbi:hypothetical protein BD830_104413 [Maritimibacter alkaliphilus HTCC2654]|uniref:Putative transporter, AEC family protein n=1 Tax=Maritimibacter alkaliphilus HTCC2654 TaxID=314271 RepID=A3VBP5_9RHOB|nr:AEC family transporter [Maritimibacter alkaliphilus]EAQ14378.1 Putative transporter, AEC family protein [Rhodobacterales bacterium HTCC2654] [Maritimibacter alkaliphilus HTCC2654]TYP82531.1 hypothetical protein BD830_104413 [Maritimibacter alkaliphilus HTCC2654]